MATAHLPSPFRRLRASAALIGLILAGTSPAAGADEEAARLEEGVIVLEEILNAPDAAIPRALLDRAVAVAVFPSTVKAGFFLGGQRGRGFIAGKDPDTGAWSAPAFMTLTGGSIGLQVGAQSADVILLIQNRRGLRRLLDNQFKLGGDASAVVGPIGRSLEASTDLQLTAEILSYSRTRGVFAGAALGGATFRADRDANERFYGTRLDSVDIVLDGRTGEGGAGGGGPVAGGAGRPRRDRRPLTTGARADRMHPVTFRTTGCCCSEPAEGPRADGRAASRMLRH